MRSQLSFLVLSAHRALTMSVLMELASAPRTSSSLNHQNWLTKIASWSATEINIHFKLLGALLLASFSVIANAQVFPGIVLADFRPNPAGITITGNTVGLAVRFAFTQTQDPSDSFPNGDFIVPAANSNGNSIVQNVSFGSTAGVRIIQFCRDTSATAPCDPSANVDRQIIHYAYFRTQGCGLSPPSSIVVAPATTRITASCDITPGTGAAVGMIKYQWAVSGQTPTQPPANAATTIALSTPNVGSYSVSVSPSYQIAVTRGTPFNDSVTVPTVFRPPTANALVRALSAPTVSITAPANNSTYIAPATIDLTANATAPDTTITRVDYLADGRLIGSATTPPFAFSWQNVSAGNYVVAPRVVPALGNPVDGRPITLIVGATTTSVSITTPANNTAFTAPATVALAASATAQGATITSVEYLVNGAVIGSATTPPFAFNWQNVIAGNYTITPRAVPAVGNSFEGAPIGIVVSNPPATIIITSPGNSSTFAAPATIPLTANASTPGTTVTRVEYLVNNAVIGQSTAPPYGATWNNVQPGTYSISARVVPATGAAVISAPVSVTVGTPPPPLLSCRVNSPPPINTAQGTALTASCTRNGIPVSNNASGPNEVLNYQWRAIGAAPLVSSTSNVLSLPSGTFKKSGSYEYGVIATIRNSLYPSSSVAAPEAIGVVKVERTVATITVTTSVADRTVMPGERVSFTFLVRDDEGPLPGREVRWAIVGGNTKQANGKAKSSKACASDDAPKGEQVTTNAQGEGNTSFVAGCATGGRDVLLTAGSVSELVKLTGPDQLATKVILLKGAMLVNAEPDKATQVVVGVVDSAGAKVVSSTTTWSIDPPTAGFVSPTAVSDAEGIARSTLLLNKNVDQAQLQVCIEGKPGTCVKIPVRNTATAVAAPAEALIKPAARQAVDAPRVQINNIRNRLQQLRIEEAPRGSTGASESNGEEKSANGTPKTGFGGFMLGEIELAKRESANEKTSYKLRTKGVTLGGDYRADKSLVVGTAFGALVGDTTLTGGSQKIKGYSASLFAQWLPSKDWHANAIINVGRNRIDNQRTSVFGETLSGSGDTTQLGFQIETGYGFSKDGARFTPFARFEMIRAKLKPFEESGGADALAISGQTVRANAFGAGLVAEYAISTSSGVWIPSGRLEFLSESQKQDQAYARLINGSPVLVPLSAEAMDKNFGTWSLNLQWLAGPRGTLISSFFGYEQIFGKTGFKNDRVTAGVKIPF
jgi:Autotransporter beta-domain/Bacterial Ig domain